MFRISSIVIDCANLFTRREKCHGVNVEKTLKILIKHLLWRSLINRHRTWYFLGNFVKFFRQFYHGIRYSGCFLYGDITKYRNEVNFKFVPTTMKRNKLDLILKREGVFRRSVYRTSLGDYLCIQLTFTCWKSTIETLGKGVKYVQS